MRLDPTRERAILDAAAALLSEVGFDRMSIDQIARRAGASKATIYRRWAGKEALVVDLVRGHLKIDVTPPPATGSMRDDLVAVVKAFCEVLEREHNVILGLFPALLTASEVRTALRDRVPHPRTAPLLDLARERGEPAAKADPGEVGAVVEALVWYRLIFTGRPLDGAFAEHTVDRVLLPLLRSWSEAKP